MRVIPFHFVTFPFLLCFRGVLPLRRLFLFVHNKVYFTAASGVLPGIVHISLITYLASGNGMASTTQAITTLEILAICEYSYCLRIHVMFCLHFTYCLKLKSAQMHYCSILGELYGQEDATEGDNGHGTSKN